MLNFVDRAIGYLAPRWGLQRQRARVATEILARHYDAAAVSRRTQGWRRTSTDANAASGPSLKVLRDLARDLVRNNPHADNAVDTIADHTVGWGIVPKPQPMDKQAAQAWAEWAGSTACDSEGRNDFAGLQDLAMRTIVESGEVLIRRRFRRPDDNLPLPMQLQVLEPDYLDTLKTGLFLPNGGRIIHGVEFDALGRRVAYWLFREHPGAEMFGGSSIGGLIGGTSVRVPAEGVLHVFRQERPGQTRGVSWFGPVMLKMRDYDEYDDAQLVKQKIAACLAVLTSDVDGTAPPLGVQDPEHPEVDSLEPGMILNVPPGRSISVVQPPRVSEFGDYSEITLRAIATGLGVTYEDLTGDYTDLPFSAARMSRLRHQARVHGWRWKMIVPQLCDPVWKWAMQAGQISGRIGDQVPAARWTAPPMPMVDPEKEAAAHIKRIRGGLSSLSEAIREMGYDPDELLGELAKDLELLDKLGLVLDSDPRNRTQVGGPVTMGTAPAPADDEAAGGPAPKAKPANGGAEA